MKSGKQALRIAATLSVLLVFALGVGCNGFFVDPTLTSLVVSPTNPTIGVNKTLQMTAFGTYDDGTRKQVNSGLNWTSSTPGVATIGLTSGVATGSTAGTTTITGEAQGITGTATLTVVPSGITSIRINPVTASVAAQGQQKFSCLDQNGVDRSTLCTWSSSDTTDVTIDNTGLATSITAPTTPVVVTITATLQTDVTTLTATAKLNVQ
jgi:hypothetical protein